MAKHATQAIRAIALVGHGAAGKTTLAEALLHKAGAIPAAGSVEQGTTVCDFDPLEKEFSIRLRASLVHFSHSDTRIHLIDTPGYPDFLGQSLSALDAVETAAVVDQRADRHRDDHAAHDGVGARSAGCAASSSSTRSTRRTSTCRRCSPQIQAAFGKECLPINLPADRRQAGRRLLLQSGGRRGFLVRRRRAPRARRPGRRGRRRADGHATSSRARSRPSSCMRRSSRRCAKATWCRCASCRRAPAPAWRSCSTSSRG